MHNSVEKLNFINNRIKEIISTKQPKILPNIIAVSKTFPLEKIEPLLISGHEHFGENKVQEAEKKWNNVKKKYSKLQLHMIGKLQSNKAKKAVLLFDYIHSLDSKKVAIKIKEGESEFNKKVKLFIQVNLGSENQKSGISPQDLKVFFHYCTHQLSLNVIGLMCLPPINSDSSAYFKKLNKCAQDLKLDHLSMGMSFDYENAVLQGSTFLRIGTSIFGQRTN